MIHNIVPYFPAALLLTNLNNPVILFISFHHDITFFNRISHWLFNINIFSSLAGIDHLKTVPVIRSTDNHSINIPVLQ